MQQQIPQQPYQPYAPYPGPAPLILPPPTPPYVDTYGSRINEYKNLGKAGLVMTIIAPIFFLPFFGPYGMVGAISLLFIGPLCGISGYMGYRDEFAKLGKPRFHNWWGFFASGMGITSVFSGSAPGLPFIFGIIAILLGKKAYATGDLEFGEVGMYCGAIGIIEGFIMIIIFWNSLF